MRRSFFLLLIAVVLAWHPARAAVIRVSPGPGTPLQDAIAGAAPGDTIKVAGGVYDGAVVVDRAVRILGDDVTVRVDAGCGVANALEVTADGVEIKNMRVDGGTANGVVVEGRTGVRLKRMGIFNTCGASGAAVRLVQVSDLRLNNVRGGIWPIGTYVADLAANSRVDLKLCGGEGSPFGGMDTAVLVENVNPGALRMSKCQIIYAEDAGIELRNSDGVRISSSIVVGRGVGSPSRGIVADANSDDNSVVRNSLHDNQVDVVDQGIGNCWRGNRNPNGVPLTGNPSTDGCS